MVDLWKKIMESLEEAIFPSNIYCISCGSLIDRSRPYALCDKCAQKFHWINGRTCDKCGKALQDTYRGKVCYDCMTYEHYFTKGFSCLTYGLYERGVLLDYKYNGKSWMGSKLGDILYDRISCENIHPDVIIPVPISAGRAKKRGYNQSALMGKRLSEKWGIPMDERLLVRAKDTQLLRSLNPAERRLVLEGVFKVPEKHRKNLLQKSVLLIDDIFTTGATADICSKTLLDAGAKEVYLLTLASGGNRKPEIEE